MQVTIRHIDRCPCLAEAEQRVARALERVGVQHAVVRRELVRSLEDAERLGFVGSPTILIDGIDPFARPGSAPAIACRIYLSPSGPGGAPTIDELEEAIRSRQPRE